MSKPSTKRKLKPENHVDQYVARSYIEKHKDMIYLENPTFL